MHGRRLLGASLVAAAALAAAVAKAEFVLLHEEDFSRRTALDDGFWRVQSGFGWNREAQYYAPGNVRVENGALVLEARAERVANAAFKAGARDPREKRREARYTSGAIASREPLHFGRVEVVARTPRGAGLWPAIWLLHEQPGLYGEIDLYEYVGKHPGTAFSAVHYGRTPRTREHRNGSLQLPGLEDRWRTHVLEWTPERIAATLDGQPVFTFDPREAAGGGLDPLRQPMHLRINLAVGGSWGGPIDADRLPARFEIASVRVWRWAPAAAQPAPAPDLAPPGPAAPVVPAAAALGVDPEPPPAPAPAPVTTPRWGR